MLVRGRDFRTILPSATGSPRPERDHSIYRDLVIESGEAGRPAGEPRAFADMVAEAGFTDRELGWLASSERESNALAELEDARADRRSRGRLPVLAFGLLSVVVIVVAIRS